AVNDRPQFEKGQKEDEEADGSSTSERPCPHHRHDCLPCRSQTFPGKREQQAHRGRWADPPACNPTQQPKEECSAKEQEQDIDAEQIEHQNESSQGKRPEPLENRAPQVPQCLSDNRDHYGLNAIKEPANLGKRS